MGKGFRGQPLKKLLSFWVAIGYSIYIYSCIPLTCCSKVGFKRRVYANLVCFGFVHNYNKFCGLFFVGYLCLGERDAALHEIHFSCERNISPTHIYYKLKWTLKYCKLVGNIINIRVTMKRKECLLKARSKRTDRDFMYYVCLEVLHRIGCTSLKPIV